MKRCKITVVFLVLFALIVTVPAVSEGAGKNGRSQALTTEEAEGLLFMREEEKLARDVYNVLYNRWGLQIFANIAESEQRHTDAVLYLLGKYDLDDPAMAPGEFWDKCLQDLYDSLILKGLTSITDAIEVGVIIEETDIIDIKHLLDQTNKDDIIQVYNNLLDGSYSHLDAFQSF